MNAMIKRTMTSMWMLALCALFFVLSSACSDDKGAAVPPALDDAGCAAPEAGAVRSPAGDSACAASATCGLSNQPDHQGYPNTCDCRYYQRLCYDARCTAIGACTEPPVYR